MENKSQLSNISEQNEQKSFWLSRFEKAEYELEYIPYAVSYTHLTLTTICSV